MDYDIAIKVIANRLAKVLPDIISPNQTGYVKNRYIGENVRLISDVIDFTKAKQTQGVTLFLDFKKALDSIESEYLHKVLDVFNFKQDFKRWVKYLNISTKYKLKRANLIADDLCHLCKSEQHTIQHMFLKCYHVALFWNEFFHWWSQVTGDNIQLPDWTILYGPTNPLKHHQTLSLALLVAKYLIYKCNLNEQSLPFSLFKIQLRENIMTERYIGIKKQNCQAF